MAHWTDQGLCAQTDPELFFPEMGASSRLARSLCAKCPVQTTCLTEALKDHTLMGIWGGTNQKERKLIRSQK